MISYLKGRIIRGDEKSIVIDTGTIGYKVHVTADTSLSLPPHSSEEVSLWTYMAVRENAIDLYGFKESRELDMFELLITISGIGPKTALGILNSASVDALEQAITTGEIGHLTKVSGIGKKNADKIVLELKGKVIPRDGMGARMSAEAKDIDVIEALKSLGYSPTEARDVLKEVPKEVVGTNARIKEALKLLSK